ncbi:MAG: ATP-binding protein, partial [Janthinobacterium lividum]
ERTEENPDTLEDLFTLDHLATRMRRNAESLLVLAGINTGRRLRRPLPLSDVVRTAAGEIEFYDRVDLSLQVDPPVVGHLALTLSHLIAELLENSTRFSDPGSRVVVATSETDRGVEVSITDTGLGMNAEELEAANSRISGGRASEIVGAQRLGFYVVGRLAGRLDVEVRIDTAEGQGTKVTLLLLAPLFTPGSVRGGQPGLAALDAGRPAIERGPSGGSDVVPSALPDEAHPASAPGALPSRTAARAARQPAADTSTTAKVEGPSTIVSNPLAAEGLGDALSATLEQSAANQAVTGPTPTSTAPGRNLPSRRKRGGQEAPAAAPVAPGTGDETAFTPVTAPATGGSMPKRERQAEAPNARAAAEDILPRAGRKPRPVRESATPPQTAAEAFWTARKSTEKGATPVGRSALDAQPESVVETSGTPSPVSDTSVQAAPEQPVAQSAPAAAPVEAPTPRPVVDALRQRSALAAEALSALTEGHSFSPSMGSGSQPLVRRQAGATEAGAK